MCLPARNQKDFEDVPEETRKVLRFHWASDIEQVLREILALRELKLEPVVEGPSPSSRISASADAHRPPIRSLPDCRARSLSS